MPTFFLIWFGQMVSTIGSYMTVFALTIWVWDSTNSATALTLVGFFSQLPRIFVTPVAGIIVDRVNRKYLMLIGDLMAGVCTIAVAVLYIEGSLQIWHLYLVVAVYSGFGQVQSLAYSTSIALMVPKENYTRAESMVAAVNYGSAIISPALAGRLYPVIGLQGIIAIDLITFVVALCTLFLAKIPQPNFTNNEVSETMVEQLTFGLRYIVERPSLVAMVIAFSLFAMANDVGKAIYSPMILARSGGSSEVLGNVTAAAGIGGVLGGILLSFWGGFSRRINGMLLGFMGTGLFKSIMGIGQAATVWMGSHFFASLNIPLFYSSSNSIWYSKVPPKLQGRVLGADQTIGLIIASGATLIAGPLADQVFEPAMQSGGLLASMFGGVFGSEAGSGIALLYTLTAVWMFFVGLGGYAFQTLREVEVRLPDHDS
ncbi:MFS transporter [Crocosphaera sp. Alani8]|uniref:MFS transporter n=1 Tax=Crocosphaera sp. Alani8 TaxID=3038952 RepID=UPI00313AECFB